ncbi:MAG: nuclear transport factor 2 family protein [Chloroflexi bacterium]|nr:nuclear transport factor 2 family protein [Chloroflexota bacterium]MDA1145306.1 nuclear transport factor 2 family protein [Chloroflexota bacterium]
MLDAAFAAEFARDWIEAWNSHDLPRVLAHYTEDFEMSSPVIPSITGDPSGTLAGKPAVAAYWTKALGMMPNLHFDLETTLFGVDSITLYYEGHRGPSAEVFFFNGDGLVTRAFAHYAR